MTLSHFIHQRRERWQELETLLTTAETKRLSALRRLDLKRLGQLYRVLTSDLAFAQTNFPQSDVAQMLNQLAARTHPFVYRGRSLTARGLWDFFRTDVPRTFRANLHYFSLSATIFFVTAFLGAIATMINEDAAGVILNPQMINFIHRREMWTDTIFRTMPGSIMSAAIFTNNISVAFTTFAMGMTFGVGTCYMLALNGLMLGTILTMCWRYGMLDKLLAFITAHGVVEISIILVAGAAGLMLGNALMNPGEHTRRDALAINGHEAVKLIMGTAPLLVMIGMVEGFISPHPGIPVYVKMTLGLGLGALFYLYLLCVGRSRKTTNV